MGELVAELCSTYLAVELGLPPANLYRHAAYLRSWLDGMKQSPSFIFTACSHASRTTDYLLSFVHPVDASGAAEGEPTALVAAAR
jgi:antirestriction protein ArdC